MQTDPTYRKISNISGTKSQNLNVSRLGLQLSLCNILKPGVKPSEDVVGAAPTGDAPTTSEWSTIYLPTKVRLILETWRYLQWLHPSRILAEIPVCSHISQAPVYDRGQLCNQSQLIQVHSLNLAQLTLS